MLDGGSTGGWVALALQVFYPDFFNGAWSFCPDSVDFRSFQLVNIYEDENAYINRHGFERPAARDVSGEVRFTMRHECRLENVLGRGDSWALSGGQWGAWNATYGARGRRRPARSRSGTPRPGEIDRAAAEHWKAYDLRRVLEERWAELGPKLQGEAAHLGRRGRRLLPQQRRAPPRRVPLPRPARLRGLDHLRPRAGPLLDGDLRARDDEADGPARRGDDAAPHRQSRRLNRPCPARHPRGRRGRSAASSPSSSSARSGRRPAPAAGRQSTTRPRSATTRSPDPLVDADGGRSRRPRCGTPERRPELLRLFETDVYGKVPQPPEPIRPVFRSARRTGRPWAARRSAARSRSRSRDKPDGPRMDLLIYLPKDAGAARRVPAFLGLNFGGNHAVSTRPGDHASRTQWMRNDPTAGRRRTTAPPRRRAARRRRAGRSSGSSPAAMPWRPPTTATSTPTSTTASRTASTRSSTGPARRGPRADEWGSIGAWAWGLSRALDYLETVPEIDAKKVAVMGHSRLGKTALWAGASDPRFAIVISNNSGCGGAALSRRIFGETVGADQHVVPPLVLRQLPQVQRPRGPAARSTSTS